MLESQSSARGFCDEEGTIALISDLGIAWEALILTERGQSRIEVSSSLEECLENFDVSQGFVSNYVYFQSSLIPIWGSSCR